MTGRDGAEESAIVRQGGSRDEPGKKNGRQVMAASSWMETM
ncbi:hypothetical protein O166_17580 [Pseudogulbenkiania ferrooxidans EGD-HP2]|uniref:Uncharacterized protein n=1 Tax=Pseudogulbenkiania ferrooxidans EGD-HP2 TaxID=1388764 RepID=A0ABN0N126_9NEIS|nr:hypothetical protein O166_17580 [Pseudogulbenkiania ferrooxidans EGD-HP2]